MLRSRWLSAWLGNWGGLDILVNNAGITIGGQFVADMALADWHRVLDVNLNSVLYMCKAALPLMRARSGAVVNIASNVVNTLPGGAAAYATTKAGVVALTKVLSKEEAEHGIRVNVVSPGIIDAGMGSGALARRTPEVRAQFLSSIPMRRAGGPEEVAAAVVFLVSPAASYVTGAAHKRQRRRPHRVLPVGLDTQTNSLYIRDIGPSGMSGSLLLV